VVYDRKKTSFGGFYEMWFAIINSTPFSKFQRTKFVV